MKCPKCLYIGFETGERCKNCGYDFSLLAMADEAEAERRGSAAAVRRGRRVARLRRVVGDGRRVDSAGRRSVP